MIAKVNFIHPFVDHMWEVDTDHLKKYSGRPLLSIEYIPTGGGTEFYSHKVRLGVLEQDSWSGSLRLEGVELTRPSHDPDSPLHIHNIMGQNYVGRVSESKDRFTGEKSRIFAFKDDDLGFSFLDTITRDLCSIEVRPS